MSMYTGTVRETLFHRVNDYTALATFTSEADLLQGQNRLRPVIPRRYFTDVRDRLVTIRAAGVVGCTGTPTYLFTIRIGTGTSWAATDSQVGVTVAITMQSGVSNQLWELIFNLSVTIQGFGTNMTLAGYGWVESPGGFASPFKYEVEATTPDTATWTTASIDGALEQYVGLSVTCGTSSASNTIQCKSLTMYGEN